MCFLCKTDKILEIKIKIGLDKIRKNQKLVINIIKIIFFNFF